MVTGADVNFVHLQQDVAVGMLNHSSDRLSFVDLRLLIVEAEPA